MWFTFYQNYFGFRIQIITNLFILFYALYIIKLVLLINQLYNVYIIVLLNIIYWINEHGNNQDKQYELQMKYFQKNPVI